MEKVTVGQLSKKSKRNENAHSDNIWSVGWCLGDVLSGSVDGTMKIWDTEGDEFSLKYTTAKRRSGVTSFAAVQDGSRVIICYEDSEIRVYDVMNQTETGQISPGLLEAWSICLSPGDDVLASGNNKGDINIWTMHDGYEKVAKLQTDNKFILSTVFSSDGKLASGGVDGMLNIFDMSNQTLCHKVEAHALPIRSLAFSPTGDLIYTASDDRHVSVCDVRSGQVIGSFSHPGMALSVDASPNHREFLVGGSDQAVHLWDLGMQRCVARHEAVHTDRVGAVSYDKSDSTGRRYVSGGDDGVLQLYE